MSHAKPQEMCAGFNIADSFLLHTVDVAQAASAPHEAP